MRECNAEQLRSAILKLAVILFGISAMMLFFSGNNSLVSFIFFSITFICMAAHWWLLASFASCLLAGNLFETAFRAMFLMLPPALAFSLVFVAVRRRPDLIVPSVAGLVALPLAITAWSLVIGLRGSLVAGLQKGTSHE